MKVAIVTSFPENPEAPSGGVETVSINLVEALAKFDDLDIDVVHRTLLVIVLGQVLDLDHWHSFGGLGLRLIITFSPAARHGGFTTCVLTM